jgi:transposase-like protein
MTGRSRYRIILSDEERVELEHRAAHSRPHRDVQRARLVLYAAEGLTNSEIAGRLGVAPEVVGRWRRRFYEQRLEGLSDRKPAGRPRRFPPGGRRAGQDDRLRAAQGATPPPVAPQ